MSGMGIERGDTTAKGRKTMPPIRLRRIPSRTMQAETSHPAHKSLKGQNRLPKGELRRGVRRGVRRFGKCIALGKNRSQERMRSHSPQEPQGYPTESILFTISTLIDNIVFVSTLVDTGCTSYGVIDEYFVGKNKLQHIPITPRQVTAFDGDQGTTTIEIIRLHIDIDSHI